MYRIGQEATRWKLVLSVQWMKKSRSCGKLGSSLILGASWSTILFPGSIGKSWSDRCSIWNRESCRFTDNKFADSAIWGQHGDQYWICWGNRCWFSRRRPCDFRKLAYFDVDVTGFGYTYGQLPGGMPLYFEASRYLIGEMTKAAEATNHNVKNGLIVTGDSFINDGRKVQEILRHFPDALACEMEGAAIAQTAKHSIFLSLS